MESKYRSYESKPEFAMETEKSYWSSTESEEEFLAAYRCAAQEQVQENLEVFRGLQEQWPGGFFQVLGDEWEVGRKIAEGAQAEIFEAERTLPDGTKDKWVLKAYTRGTRLRDLMNYFPKGILNNLKSNGHSSFIYFGMILQDGRIAMLMKRYWGDLRKLIDLEMQRNSFQGPPFPDTSMVVQIMLDIALGMQALHEHCILHRDLKASNVLIQPLGDDNDPLHGGKFTCHVANFEVSDGVVGTAFWRAPEILSAIKNRNIVSDVFTKKSDVYSFAMTCYEILIGRIPFDGELRTRDYDAVLGGARPVLPEFIDLWMKELLEMCWLPDPSQRPSFKGIVDILKTKSVEGREPSVLVPHSSTWEELNDPRVKRDQDPSLGVRENFPVLIEMLKSALQCCEEEVGNIKRCEHQGGMFKYQCAHLVKTLPSDADKLFCQFQQVRQILKEVMMKKAHMQWIRLKYWFKCVAFGVHSLVDLTRNFRTVVEMLSECGTKDCWKMAFQYSTPPPHPEIPRWSTFGLALQHCQWSMDIAHLAITEITDLANDVGGWMLNTDSRFQWCEEQQRAVLQNTEELSGSLGVAARLEAQDKSELIQELEELLYNTSYKSSQNKSQENEFNLASFLLAKLAGPVPQPSYLPYSFHIDPPVNLVSRDSATAKWCDKLLCHVKKVKRPRYVVREIVERDATPLAVVQHPNVVRLIGCTVQTSGEVTGLTGIATEFVMRLVSPFRKKRVLEEANGVVVMELMEGDLRSLMDQRCLNPRPDSRPFPLLVALDIMLQIAEAMRFVHEHRIWHRDLKTTNILFHSASTGALPSYPTLDLDRIRKLDLLYLLTPERFYTIKLAHFGSTKYSPTESSHSVDAHTGNPRYMALEMFYNSKAEVPSKYNWLCDVYSYAMTCSAILTGNEPFHFIEKSTTCKVMASVVDRMAEVQVWPDLGLGDALPSLKSLIERCWNKDPSKRPPFSEICRELWNCKVKATISCLRRRF